MGRIEVLEDYKNYEDLDFLIGKSIVKVLGYDDLSDKVVDYCLVCSDGTRVVVELNEGCGGCGRGWSELTGLEKLAENNNAITNIRYEWGEGDEYDESRFTAFIYHCDNKYSTVMGDIGYDDVGCYGSGYWVTIKKVIES
jgi:hypothetical protein